MKTWKRNISVLLVVAMMLSIYGNSLSAEAKKKVKVSSIKITNVKKKLNLQKGKTFRLKTKVKVKPNKNKYKKVRYTSSNKKVVTVSVKGIIKARKAGKAKVTVASKYDTKKKKSITVTVSERDLSYEEDAEETEENTASNMPQASKNPIVTSPSSQNTNTEKPQEIVKPTVYPTVSPEESVESAIPSVWPTEIPKESIKPIETIKPTETVEPMLKPTEKPIATYVPMPINPLVDYTMDLGNAYRQECSDVSVDNVEDEEGRGCWKLNYTKKNQNVLFQLPESIDLSRYESIFIDGYVPEQLALRTYGETLDQQKDNWSSEQATTEGYVFFGGSSSDRDSSGEPGENNREVVKLSLDYIQKGDWSDTRYLSLTTNRTSPEDWAESNYYIYSITFVLKDEVENLPTAIPGNTSSPDTTAVPDATLIPEWTPDVPDATLTPERTPDVPDTTLVPEETPNITLIPEWTPDVPDTTLVPEETPNVPDTTLIPEETPNVPDTTLIPEETPNVPDATLTPGGATDAPEETPSASVVPAPTGTPGATTMPEISSTPIPLPGTSYAVNLTKEAMTGWALGGVYGTVEFFEDKSVGFSSLPCSTPDPSGSLEAGGDVYNNGLSFYINPTEPTVGMDLSMYQYVVVTVETDAELKLMTWSGNSDATSFWAKKDIWGERVIEIENESGVQALVYEIEDVFSNSSLATAIGFTLKSDLDGNDMKFSERTATLYNIYFTDTLPEQVSLDTSENMEIPEPEKLQDGTIKLTSERVPAWVETGDYGTVSFVNNGTVEYSSQPANGQDGNVYENGVAFYLDVDKKRMDVSGYRYLGVTLETDAEVKVITWSGSDNPEKYESGRSIWGADMEKITNNDGTVTYVYRVNEVVRSTKYMRAIGFALKSDTDGDDTSFTAKNAILHEIFFSNTVEGLSDTIVLEDFEDYTIGQEWERYMASGNEITAMTVVQDPERPNNKCLKIEYDRTNAASRLTPIFGVDLSKVSDRNGNLATGTKLADYTNIQADIRVIGQESVVKDREIYCYFDQYGAMGRADCFANDVKASQATGSNAYTKELLYNGKDTMTKYKYMPQYLSYWDSYDSSTWYTAYSATAGYQSRQEASRTIGFATRYLVMDKSRIDQADNTLLNASKFDVVLGTVYDYTYLSSLETVTVYLDNICMGKEVTPLTGIELSTDGTTKAYPGQQFSVIGSYKPDATSQKGIVWSTSNKKVTVDCDGIVTVAADYVFSEENQEEIVTITATSKENPEISDSVDIVIYPVPEDIEISLDHSVEDMSNATAETVSVEEGESYTRLNYECAYDYITFELPTGVYLSDYEGIEIKANVPTGMEFQLLDEDKESRYLSSCFEDGSHPLRLTKDTSLEELYAKYGESYDFSEYVDESGMVPAGTAIGPKDTETATYLLSVDTGMKTTNYVRFRTCGWDPDSEYHIYSVKLIAKK